LDKGVIATGGFMLGLVLVAAVFSAKPDPPVPTAQQSVDPAPPPSLPPAPLFSDLPELPLLELDRDDQFVSGIALGLYDKRENATYDQPLAEIAEVGADSVSLVVTWGQDTIYDTEITADDEESREDEAVLATISAAHREGLRVLLFPILKIRTRETGQWRGTLEPTDVDLWFASYTDYILHYARLAEQAGVEIFSVGSELGSMEVYETRWRELIRQVRQEYSGRLLYSANWDHYRLTKIWDEVDLMGLTAYYELAESEEEEVDLQLLTSRWGPIRDEIVEFFRHYERPFIFTELGYYSQPGTAWHPWDYTRRVGAEVTEQYLCYRAFYEVWKDVPEFGGVFFWHWYGEGGPTDQTYTPRGKPAAAVIQHWFEQTPYTASQGR